MKPLADNQKPGDYRQGSLLDDEKPVPPVPPAPIAPPAPTWSEALVDYLQGPRTR
jgi:hypothetical protein